MSSRYCRRDTCGYSSGRILGYLNTNANILDVMTFSTLQQYADLYSEFKKRRDTIKTLEDKKSELNGRLSAISDRNPFSVFKKFAIQRELLAINQNILNEYSNVYTVILNLLHLERSEIIYDILKNNSKGYELYCFLDELFDMAFFKECSFLNYDKLASGGRYARIRQPGVK